MKLATLNMSIRKSVFGTALTLGLLASGQAAAELSANLGYSSEYIFRGIYQAESSASGGVDYSHESGFYLGTWAADVNLGLEYDLYGGYSGSVQDFSYGVGFTGYFYTDEFDDTYKEINLSVGYGPVTLTHNIGTYETDPDTLDYSFSTAKVEYNGFHALYGKFGKDFEGSYVELGYGVDVSDFSLSGTLVKNDKDLDLINGEGETRLVFNISKSFDL